MDVQKMIMDFHFLKAKTESGLSFFAKG